MDFFSYACRYMLISGLSAFQHGSLCCVSPPPTWGQSYFKIKLLFSVGVFYNKSTCKDLLCMRLSSGRGCVTLWIVAHVSEWRAFTACPAASLPQTPCPCVWQRRIGGIRGIGGESAFCTWAFHLGPPPPLFFFFVLVSSNLK